MSGEVPAGLEHTKAPSDAAGTARTEPVQETLAADVATHAQSEQISELYVELLQRNASDRVAQLEADVGARDEQLALGAHAPCLYHRKSVPQCVYDNAKDPDCDLDRRY